SAEHDAAHVEVHVARGDEHRTGVLVLEQHADVVAAAGGLPETDASVLRDVGDADAGGNVLRQRSPRPYLGERHAVADLDVHERRIDDLARRIDEEVVEADQVGDRADAARVVATDPEAAEPDALREDPDRRSTAGALAADARRVG